MLKEHRTFKIPIKPHLKKFIMKAFDYVEPIKVEEDTFLGKNIMSLIIDKRSVSVPWEGYSEEVVLELSKQMAERSPKVRRLARINILLDRVFKQSLFLWVKAQHEAGIVPFQATKNFLAHFGIEEKEYSHDAAYRAWLRWKNGELLSVRRKYPTRDIK